MTTYEPGVCNIGPAAQRQRAALGAIGLLGTLVFVVVVLATAAPPVLLLATAVPLFLCAEGFLQARAGFCTWFATLGVYEVSPDGTARHEVTDPTDRAADRRRAREIHAEALGLALVGAGLVYVVGALGA